MKTQKLGLDSATDTIKVDLSDLPTSKFKISINQGSIQRLISKLNLRGKKLYVELNTCESQCKKKPLSVKRLFLSDWKQGRRIPIDCFHKLCDIANENPENYSKSIFEVNSGSSSNPWKTTFPITLDSDFFTLAETIKVEGYIMKEHFQGFAISNKDIQLLERIEECTLKKGVDVSCFSRMLHIYIYLSESQEIKSIKDANRNELHFKVNNGRLIFTKSVKNYDINEQYVLTLKDNTTTPLSVCISNNLISTRSDLVRSTAHAVLQVYNSVFSRALHHIFKIPVGIGTQKSYVIDLPFDISLLSEDILKTILSVVFSCESNVLLHKGTRSVKIKMASRIYLIRIRTILKKFDIDTTLVKSTDGLHVLTVWRRANLLKLSKIIDWFTVYKKQTMDKILNSYMDNRFTHYEAQNKYLLCLRENGFLTVEQASKLIGRGEAAVRKYFNILCNKNLAKRRKTALRTGGFFYTYYLR